MSIIPCNHPFRLKPIRFKPIHFKPILVGQLFTLHHVPTLSTFFKLVHSTSVFVAQMYAKLLYRPPAHTQSPAASLG